MTGTRNGLLLDRRLARRKPLIEALMNDDPA
jgi:hypothetical protein